MGDKSFVLSSIVDITGKSNLESLKEGLGSITGWINGLGRLKDGSGGVNDAFLTAKKGLFDWFKVWDESFKANQSSTEKLLAANSKFTERGVAGFNLMKNTMRATWEASNKATEGLFALAKVPVVTQAIAIYGVYTLVNAAVGKFAEILGNTGAAAVEYNKNIMLVKAAAIDAGQATEKFTEHLGGAASRAVYDEAGKQLSGLSKVFDGVAEVAGALGTATASVLTSFPAAVAAAGAAAVVAGPSIAIIATTIGAVVHAAGGLDGVAKGLKSIGASINNVFIGDAIKTTSEDFKKFQNTVEGVGQSLNKISIATGVSFEELHKTFKDLETATGDARASMASLQAAMAISASTGFSSFKELSEVFGKFALGADVSDAQLRKFGVNLEGVSKQVLTASDRFNLLIEAQYRMGKVSGDVANEIRNSATAELQIKDLEERLAAQQQFGNISAQVELKYAKQMAEISSASADVNIKNIQRVLQAERSALEERNNLVRKQIELQLAYARAFGGGQQEALQASSANIGKYYSERAALLDKSLKTELDANKRSLDAQNNIRTSYAKQFKELSIEASTAAIDSYNREKMAAISTANSIMASRKEILETQISQGYGIAGDDNVSAVSDARVRSLNESLALIKKEFDTLDARGQRSSTGQELLARAAQLNAQRTQVLMAFNQDLKEIINSSQEARLNYEKALGSSSAMIMEEEKKIFAQKEKFAIQELNMVKNSAVEKARAEISLYSLRTDHAIKLASYQRNLGKDALEMSQQDIAVLKERTIREEQLLDMVKKRGKEGGFSTSNPSEFQRQIVAGAGSTGFGAFAANAAAIEDAKKLAPDIAKLSGEFVKQLKASQASGGGAADAAAIAEKFNNAIRNSGLSPQDAELVAKNVADAGNEVLMSMKSLTVEEQRRKRAEEAIAAEQQKAEKETREAREKEREALIKLAGAMEKLPTALNALETAVASAQTTLSKTNTEIAKIEGKGSSLGTVSSVPVNKFEQSLSGGLSEALQNIGKNQESKVVIEQVGEILKQYNELAKSAKTAEEANKIMAKAQGVITEYISNGQFGNVVAKALKDSGVSSTTQLSNPTAAEGAIKSSLASFASNIINVATKNIEDTLIGLGISKSLSAKAEVEKLPVTGNSMVDSAARAYTEKAINEASNAILDSADSIRNFGKAVSEGTRVFTSDSVVDKYRDLPPSPASAGESEIVTATKASAQNIEKMHDVLVENNKAVMDFLNSRRIERPTTIIKVDSEKELAAKINESRLAHIQR